MPRIRRFAYLRPRKSVIEPTSAFRLLKIFMEQGYPRSRRLQTACYIHIPGEL